MSICGQCGQSLGDGRFCTQCGARAPRPERKDQTSARSTSPAPAMAGAAAFRGTTTSESPRGSVGPGGSSKARARYPLFAESDTEPARDSLAETAVRPMASLPPATPAAETGKPALGARVADLADRLGAEAKRWFATADPTWVTVLTVGVGGMLVILILGMILLLH